MRAAHEPSPQRLPPAPDYSLERQVRRLSVGRELHELRSYVRPDYPRPDELAVPASGRPPAPLFSPLCPARPPPADYVGNLFSYAGSEVWRSDSAPPSAARPGPPHRSLALLAARLPSSSLMLLVLRVWLGPLRSSAFRCDLTA